jgi:hypothetical protein
MNSGVNARVGSDWLKVLKTSSGKPRKSPKMTAIVDNPTGSEEMP